MDERLFEWQTDPRLAVWQTMQPTGYKTGRLIDCQTDGQLRQRDCWLSTANCLWLIDWLMIFFKKKEIAFERWMACNKICCKKGCYWSSLKVQWNCIITCVTRLLTASLYQAKRSTGYVALFNLYYDGWLWLMDSGIESGIEIPEVA